MTKRRSIGDQSSVKTTCRSRAGLLREDFHKKPSPARRQGNARSRENSAETTGRARGLDDGPVVTRYIAPFDDRRIEAFAGNWYLQREAAATRAGADATHLVRAVHADDSILRLARTPNLLTMMALIHRVEATLPHGRALLYDRIAEAYLESIDRFRGVYSGAYNLPQKKRWLARVGYEMQRTEETRGRFRRIGTSCEFQRRDRVAGRGDETWRDFSRVVHSERISGLCRSQERPVPATRRQSLCVCPSFISGIFRGGCA